MFFNIAIGVLIFGYAGWTLYRHVKKSKQGMCSSCSMGDHCQSGCQDIETVQGKKK